MIEKLMNLVRQKGFFAKFQGNKTTWLVFISAGIFALLWDLRTEHTSEHKDVPAAVDTYIPAGYTLVPIDVQNHESLDSILGSNGIVDLYATNESGGKQVAERIKILRSPLNPSIFAVLVRADQAGPIAGHSGPFFVVIHNRKADVGSVSKSQPKKTIRIFEE